MTSLLFKKIGVFVVALLFIGNAFGQEPDKPKKWSLDGYVSFLNTNSFEDVKKDWVMDNQLHNRLNFKYYPNSKWTFSAQMRNRLMYGQTMGLYPFYSDMIDEDQGFVDMSWNVFSEKSALLNANLDRLNLLYQKGNWEVQLGRQRVNWGKTLVWNPNDIFNSYSFFDFDYEEKPGSDALRVQYYLNYASSLEFAASVNSNQKITTALKYAFNKWNYDFQMMAGEVGEEDALVGLGWAGNIWDLGFKGEASYYTPLENRDSLDNVFVATVSLDYTFKNSLSLMGQVLYTDIPNNSPIQDFSSYYTSQLNAKYLSFEEWSLFAQASYPLTPLINVGVSGMYYPQMNGYFINPTFSYSVSENVSFSTFLQYFKGEFPDPQSQLMTDFEVYYIFLRMKWSF